MSEERKKLIKELKRKKRIVLFFQILIFVAFFVTWEVLSKQKIINPFLFSSPSKVFETIKTLFTNYHLVSHIWTTLYETGITFFLGIILSFGIAIILYLFPTLNKILDPYLTMLNSLPKVALGPLIIIIVGANTKSIIVMALLINLIVGIITIYNGFLTIPSDYLKLFSTLGASKKDILLKLVIPGSYKTIISSLKLNISMTLIGVIMGEFLVSKKGIGYLIIYGTQVFNLSMVMAGILLLVILSYVLYEFVHYLEKKLLRD